MYNALDPRMPMLVKVQFKPFNSFEIAKSTHPSIRSLKSLLNSKQTLNSSKFEPRSNFRIRFTPFINLFLSNFFFSFLSAMSHVVSGSSKFKLPLKNGYRCFHLCERTLVLTLLPKSRKTTYGQGFHLATGLSSPPSP